MSTRRAAPWIVGATLVSVAVLALAWFFAISPQMAEAAEARDEAESTRSSNMVLQTQITQLAKDFARIEEFQAELATLRTGVPAALEQASLNREVEAVSIGTGAFVSGVAFSSSTEVITALEAEGLPTVTVPQGFYAIQVDITVVGSTDQVRAYVDALQQSTTRRFLVAQVGVERLVAAGATGGQPEVQDGFERMTITALTYVLLEAGASAPGGTGDPAPAAPAALDSVSTS